jgi:hypothetical protein
MTAEEANHMFDWLSGSDPYQESLKSEMDVKVFHGRFNPDNQYTVVTDTKGRRETHHAFLHNGKYHTGTNTWINEEAIVSAVKSTHG